jgi:hypothetical protein
MTILVFWARERKKLIEGGCCHWTCWGSGDEYKAGPLAEYERRIAAGELKAGDEFQVIFFPAFEVSSFHHK